MILQFINENTNLFLDYGNIRKLALLLKNIPETVKHISAAVAYTTPKIAANDISIVDICINMAGALVGAAILVAIYFIVGTIKNKQQKDK